MYVAVGNKLLLLLLLLLSSKLTVDTSEVFERSSKLTVDTSEVFESSLTVHDGSNCSLTEHDGRNCSRTLHDGSNCSLTMHDGSNCSLTVLDQLRASYSVGCASIRWEKWTGSTNCAPTTVWVMPASDGRRGRARPTVLLLQCGSCRHQMGGVDRLDQLCSYYSVGHAGIRWEERTGSTNCAPTTVLVMPESDGRSGQARPTVLLLQCGSCRHQVGGVDRLDQLCSYYSVGRAGIRWEEWTGSTNCVLLQCGSCRHQMGGVDRLDQLCSYYSVGHAGIRWEELTGSTNCAPTTVWVVPASGGRSGQARPTVLLLQCGSCRHQVRGVDRLDQLRASYSVGRASIRWEEWTGSTNCAPITVWVVPASGGGSTSSGGGGGVELRHHQCLHPLEDVQSPSASQIPLHVAEIVEDPTADHPGDRYGDVYMPSWPREGPADHPGDRYSNVCTPSWPREGPADHPGDRYSNVREAN